MVDTPQSPSIYQYMLSVPNKVSVIGNLPQEWALGVTANWEGNSTGTTIGEIAQSRFGSVGAAVTAASGTSSVGSDLLANRQWAGTSPITFNLLAEFNAVEDAAKDVMSPILRLMSLCMPTQLVALEAGKFSLGNIYGAPYFDTAASGQLGGRSQIELHLGSLFVFEDVVVENVTPTYTTRNTETGLPIHAQVEIQVGTRHLFTFEDLLASIVNPAIIDADPYLSSAKSAGSGSRAGFGISGAKETKPVSNG
jgi:hypothetical protein